MTEDSSQKLIIITAPSGSGKTTIVHYLLQHFEKLSFSVSACTREARANEQHGLNYYFLSLPDFTRKIANHEFAEFEMVYEGKYYGTLKSELQRIWDEHKIPLIDIDVQGALRLKKHYGQNAISIFIQPPGIDILEQRLRTRDTETEFSIKERIGKAAIELTFSGKFDHIVINDDLEKACNEANAIVAEFIKD